MHKLAEMFEAAGSAQSYAKQYADRLHELLARLDGGMIEKTVEALEKASEAGKTLFTIGNGGSAAACSHLVNDLGTGSFVEGQPRLRSHCLTDNVETVTAVANDSGFEDIFVCQLSVNLCPGDVVLAMSVSGNSENIIRAVEYAKEHGATTIGFCGFDGGRLLKKCDIALHIPTTKDEYGPVEDIFNILGHLVSGYMAMKRGKHLHH